MDIKEAYIKAVQDDIAYRRMLADKQAKVIPVLPVDPTTVTMSGLMSLWLIYPYDRRLMEVIDKALQEQGWQVSTTVTEAKLKSEDESPRTIYDCKLPGSEYVWMVVEYSDKVAGSTCKRQKIGEVSQTVPVYDFPCQAV